MSKKKLDKKPKVLRVEPADYYKICYLQSLVNDVSKDQRIEECEKRIKMQAALIAKLEVGLIEVKLRTLDNTRSNADKKLNDFRKEVAEKLNIGSLADYVIDDETFVVSNMNEKI